MMQKKLNDNEKELLLYKAQCDRLGRESVLVRAEKLSREEKDALRQLLANQMETITLLNRKIELLTDLANLRVKK